MKTVNLDFPITINNKQQRILYFILEVNFGYSSLLFRTSGLVIFIITSPKIQKVKGESFEKYLTQPFTSRMLNFIVRKNCNRNYWTFHCPCNPIEYERFLCQFYFILQKGTGKKLFYNIGTVKIKSVLLFVDSFFHFLGFLF